MRTHFFAYFLRVYNDWAVVGRQVRRCSNGCFGDNLFPGWLLAASRRNCLSRDPVKEA
jgi:hypothetical protein